MRHHFLSYIAFVLTLFLQDVCAQEPVLDTIAFKGLKRTKATFLKRLIKTKVGQPLDSALVENDVKRLIRLPGIANARYQVEALENGTVLTYAIEENFTIIPGAQIATAVDGSLAYRLSLFEFNLLGNNQLIGGYMEQNVFTSYGFYWQHPFLFSDKLGLGFNYQDVTKQEPIFFEEGDKDYRFNSKMLEGKFLFSFDFNNEAELGALWVKENYIFEGDDAVPGAPTELQADKLIYRAAYKYVDLDIDYQYFDGIQNDFIAQYIQTTDGDMAGKEFLKDFLSLRNDFLYYKKTGAKGNWANRLRLAVAIGNEESPFAPFTLDNQVNIRGVGNIVDRGTASIVWNTEYRHTFFEKGWFAFQGNAFIDAGTWRKPGYDLSQLFKGTATRLSTGLGIRLIHKRIFNAVFRLDYGIGLGPNNPSGIVFGIGQYF